MMFWKPWNITVFRKKIDIFAWGRTRQSDKETPLTHKKCKKSEILVDEFVLIGYNEPIVHKNKAVKRRVSKHTLFREPRVVEWGTVEFAEHGLGAVQATGSL